MNIPELLRKFELTDTELNLVREAGESLVPQLDSFVADWYAWLKGQVEFDQFFPDPEIVTRVEKLQVINWGEFFRGEITEDYIDHRRHIGEVHARIDLPTEIYLAGMSKSQQLLFAALRACERDTVNLHAKEAAIAKMIMFDSFVVLDTIHSLAREKLAEHSKVMMEMSTPVTSIWEGILLLPLVGIIDSQRTQDIMNKTLEKIAESRAKAFVLDISGVAAVDTGVANHLIKITLATRLMGCESIISGISPSVARTLVELGVNVGEVRTTATLRDAFELALETIGADIGSATKHPLRGRR